MTEGLFDDVELEQMTAAEQAVQTAAKSISTDLCEHLDSTDKLSDEDRAKIIDIARDALMPFQLKPDSDANADATQKVHDHRGFKGDAIKGKTKVPA